MDRATSSKIATFPSNLAQVQQVSNSAAGDPVEELAFV